MSDFFAYLSRMKLVQRWGLMRNTFSENIQEHSHRVAAIAHALALIRNKIYGGKLNPERIALIALYHDFTEVITGDLPTPIKYFSPGIRGAYKEIERSAADKLLSLLPKALRSDYTTLLIPSPADEESWDVVKAADKICALMKCVEERQAGNREFIQAERQLKDCLLQMDRPEIKYFLEQFFRSFELSIDELGRGQDVRPSSQRTEVLEGTV